VLADAPDGRPEVLLLATGSEVSLCVTAYERLAAEGIRARVVSMPSWELFEQQSQEYRDRVVPPDVTARVAVEQASIFGWERYVGLGGAIIGMRTFGASAPLKELQRVAERHGFHRICHGLPSIGGRYSALSDFGMVPAATMGLDVGRFLDRAEEMVQSCAECRPPTTRASRLVRYSARLALAAATR
jgi:hypothetical protein